MSPCVLLLLCPEHSGARAVSGELGRRGWHVVEAGDPALDDLHRRLLTRPSLVLATDARPEAGDLALDKLTDDDQAALERWLAAQLAAAPASARGRLVVRDPRTLWFLDLWRDAVATLHGELRVAHVARHPVAVAQAGALADADPGSDGQGAEEDAPDAATVTAEARAGLVGRVAGWTQTMLTSLEQAADDQAVVVRVDDVRADAERAVTALAEQLGLELDPVAGGAPDGPAALDGVPSADDVPPRLRDVAVRLWTALVPGPVDAQALAGLRETYDGIHDDAVAIAADHARAREVWGRRRARAAARAEYRSQIDELEKQLEEALGGRDDEDRYGDDDDLPYRRR